MFCVALSSAQILPLFPPRVHKAGKVVLPVSIIPETIADSRSESTPPLGDGVGEDGETGSKLLKKTRSRKAKPPGEGSDAEAASSTSMVSGLGGLQPGGVSPSSVPQATVDSEGWQMFYFEGGLSQYVAWMNGGKTKLHDPIYITR